MRLWSINPKYLDRQGLLALWREGLLAQKVLKGETLGYRSHPQLERFRSHADPVAYLSGFLHFVHDEACRRGYCFDEGKLAPPVFEQRVPVARGQLNYEFSHLMRKLRKRDRNHFLRLSRIREPEPNPAFIAVEGDIAKWERPYLSP